MNSMVKGISVALLLKGREKMAPDEVRQCAKMFDVSVRQVYRYVEKVAEARFYMKDLLK